MKRCGLMETFLYITNFPLQTGRNHALENTGQKKLQPSLLCLSESLVLTTSVNTWLFRFCSSCFMFPNILIAALPEILLLSHFSHETSKVHRSKSAFPGLWDLCSDRRCEHSLAAEFCSSVSSKINM